MGKAYVFSNRHPFHKAEILVDEGNFLLLVGLWCFVAIVLALETDAALIGRVDACEGFDQGGFACAIFTQKCENFAGVEMQRHITQGGGAAKALGHILKAEQMSCQILLPSAGTSVVPVKLLSITFLDPDSLVSQSVVHYFPSRRRMASALSLGPRPMAMRMRWISVTALVKGSGVLVLRAKACKESRSFSMLSRRPVGV